MPAGLFLFVSELMFVSMFTSLSSLSHKDIIFWDAQTGVVIKWIKTSALPGIIVFHGDQKTVTCLTEEHSPEATYAYYSTYDIFNGTQLFSGRTEIWDHGLGTHWAHGDTLLSAMCSWTGHHSIVNIHEFQPTSTPPLQILSSFSIPHQWGEFSFSPVSFHASFYTGEKMVILDVQDSKLLLQDDVDTKIVQSQEQFSPDGHFFAYRKSMYEISVWQNTPTGYMPWSSLRSRLYIWRFSWSPASTSILCWDDDGIELLCPSSCLNPLSLSKTRRMNRPQNHLVAYSADQVHIVMAQQCESIIMVLNHHLGTLQQLIDTGLQIWDIKIVNDTIFAVDEHMLVSWDFKASGIAHSTHDTKKMVHGLLDLSVFPGADEHQSHLILSHDCSQIVVSTSDPHKTYLFDMKTWKGFSTETDDWNLGMRFSLDGHQLWFRVGTSYYFVKLEVQGNWNSLNGEDWITLEATKGNGELLFNYSSHGYSCDIDSKWIVDPQGRNILWLPPNWRFSDWDDARWDGNFLALLHRHHPEPIIIEFHL